MVAFTKILKKFHKVKRKHKKIAIILFFTIINKLKYRIKICIPVPISSISRDFILKFSKTSISSRDHHI